MDLRKLTHHRYLIYIPGVEWSSSLKRMISAGAVPILPSPNPHVTMITNLLQEKCPDCFLTYKYGNSLEGFCSELKEIIHPHYLDTVSVFGNMSISTGHNRTSAMESFLDSRSRMASRLIEFVDNELTLEKMMKYQFDILTKLSSKQVDRDIGEAIQRKDLKVLDCATLLSYMKGNAWEEGLTWQYDEWYNDDCSLKIDSKYLSFVAL